MFFLIKAVKRTIKIKIKLFLWFVKITDITWKNTNTRLKMATSTQFAGWQNKKVERIQIFMILGETSIQFLNCSNSNNKKNFKTEQVNQLSSSTEFLTQPRVSWWTEKNRSRLNLLNKGTTYGWITLEEAICHKTINSLILKIKNKLKSTGIFHSMNLAFSINQHCGSMWWQRQATRKFSTCATAKVSRRSSSQCWLTPSFSKSIWHFA